MKAPHGLEHVLVLVDMDLNTTYSAVFSLHSAHHLTYGYLFCCIQASLGKQACSATPASTALS